MPGGRPSKFTAEVKSKILQAIKLGTPYEHACQYAGIDFRTFRRWMIKGEAAKSGKFCQFCHDIKEAEGSALVGWLARIEQAAKDGDWKAAAWKAERRFPKHFARRTIVEISEKDLREEHERIVTALQTGGDPLSTEKDRSATPPATDSFKQ